MKPWTYSKHKDICFATCLRVSAVIVDPNRDSTKHYPIQDNRNINRCGFHTSQEQHTKSEKSKWLRGVEWETLGCEILYPVPIRRNVPA